MGTSGNSGERWLLVMANARKSRTDKLIRGKLKAIQNLDAKNLSGQS